VMKLPEAAHPLWARAQDKGATRVWYEAWADEQGLLAHLLRVAVKKRRPIRGQSRVQLSRAREEGV